MWIGSSHSRNSYSAAFLWLPRVTAILHTGHGPRPALPRTTPLSQPRASEFTQLGSEFGWACCGRALCVESVERRLVLLAHVVPLELEGRGEHPIVHRPGFVIDVHTLGVPVCVRGGG